MVWLPFKFDDKRKLKMSAKGTNDHFKETGEIEDFTDHPELMKELERRETGDGDSSEAQQLRESR